jgi:ribosomal protein S18 acetylase RimI-like enzyme
MKNKPTNPTAPFLIRPSEKKDISAVLTLASALNKYFPKNSLGLLESLLRTQPTVVGEQGDELIGFLVYTLRDEETAEILWMGVKEEYHGLGLGTNLLETLELMLAERGIRRLYTSTLSYTVPYEPYRKVRTFYYRRGFKSIGTERNFYGEGIDRLVLLKNIPPQHPSAP